MKKKIFCVFLALVFLIGSSLTVYALERENYGDYEAENAYVELTAISCSLHYRANKVVPMMATTNPCCLDTRNHRTRHEIFDRQIVGTVSVCYRWREQWTVFCTRCGRQLTEGESFIVNRPHSSWVQHSPGWRRCTTCWVLTPIDGPLR